jgi:hypothetical protein
MCGEKRQLCSFLYLADASSGLSPYRDRNPFSSRQARNSCSIETKQGARCGVCEHVRRATETRLFDDMCSRGFPNSSHRTHFVSFLPSEMERNVLNAYAVEYVQPGWRSRCSVALPIAAGALTESEFRGFLLSKSILSGCKN